MFSDWMKRKQLIFLTFLSIVSIVGIFLYSVPGHQLIFLRRLRIILGTRDMEEELIYPSIITPVNLTLAGYPILDFIFIYDSERKQLESLFLSGYRDTFKSESVHCFFPASNQSKSCLIDRRIAEPSITCPLPTFEQQALQNRQSNISFILKFYNTSNQSPSVIQSSLISAPVYHRQHHHISVYTMIRNKKYELIEWIEYHLMIGIEHFYLYNNLGTDQVEIFLKPYIDRNLVTIVRWPYHPLPKYHWSMIQTASMNHMLKNFGPFNRWVGYFDVDEYFFLEKHHAMSVLNRSISLADLLDEHFPVAKYPGAVQFANCPMSCAFTQEDLLISRYTLLIEKCQIRQNNSNCRLRSKLFLRPKHVPLMRNIHALSLGIQADLTLTKTFAQFQHYHYGSLIAQERKETIFNASLQPYLDTLRKRVLIDAVLHQQRLADGI